jgi:predicted transcriptional regulator YheO
VLDAFGRPVAYMTKDDKVEIVRTLDQKGAFLIKGAIDYVAKVLCVSRYTVYNYLDEVRVGE